MVASDSRRSKTGLEEEEAYNLKVRQGRKIVRPEVDGSFEGRCTHVVYLYPESRFKASRSLYVRELGDDAADSIIEKWLASQAQSTS